MSRLNAVIDSCEGLPFRYGEHDCCMFAARCVDAMSGTALSRLLPQLYHDEESAFAFIERQGGIVNAATKLLGVDPVRGWAQARRGDVCMVDTERGPGLGVCVGQRIAVADEVGLALYPVDQARLVWRIG